MSSLCLIDFIITSQKESYMPSKRIQSYINRIKENDPSLKEIDLSSVGLKISDIEEFCPYLKYSFANSINLRGNDLYPESVEILTVNLQNSCVTTLNLGNNNLSLKSVTALARNIKNTPITTLILDGNDLAPESVEILTVNLQNSCVTTLNLGNNNLSLESVTALAYNIKNTPITTLILDGNDLAPESVKILTAYLQYNAFTALGLSNNNLSLKSITALAHNLENIPILTLDLSDNKIDLMGLKILAKSIKANMTITNLILDTNNQIDCTEVENEINSYLKRNKKIQEKLAGEEENTTQIWHFDIETKKTIKLDYKGYSLITASQKDVQKVVQYYQHHPVPGMDIKKVEIIYNPVMNRSFALRMHLLQERKDNNAFSSKWPNENNAVWRQRVNTLYKKMAYPYVDSNYPDVKLLPLWHGSKPEILDSLFRTGYASLASTDPGFFGKGIYSTHEAEYANRVYGKGALIVNWVASFSAYPTIDGDMSKLSAGANYQNYDAHFVPVVPASPDKNEINYYPTKINQQHTYTEVVVFESSQCLPRYLVELQPSLPKIPFYKSNNFYTFFNKVNSPLTINHSNLIEAAQYIYINYLSKPYTLNTNLSDWEYIADGITIVRPNHGLAHTLRTIFYTPYVVECYIQHNQNILSQLEIKEIESSIPIIQLALLFFVTGRQNEMGAHDDLTTYKLFRKDSAEAFENYAKNKLNLNSEILDLYKEAILQSNFSKGSIHAIIKICHDLDTMRCLDNNTYANVCSAMYPYIGQTHCERLANLVFNCLINTGDRILGATPLQTYGYNSQLFLESSQMVEKCMENIMQGVQEWQNNLVSITNKFVL